MPIEFSRRQFLAAGALVLAGDPAPGPLPETIAGDVVAADAYASFRIVRAEPGPPSTPEIILPAG